MSKELKIFMILFGALCTLFLGFLLFSAKDNFDRNLSYNFTGVVDTVSYDTKGTPSVVLQGNKYYLSAGYNFNYQIKKGDILKKEGGSNVYTLTKRTGQVILFKN
jgi:hypothetical protein